MLLGRLMSRPPKSGVRKPQPTGQTWPALEDKVVLGNARCCNENTTAGWLKRQSSLPGSWGLEVRGRGAGLAGSWRGLSPCLQAATAPLRPLTVERGRKGWPSSSSCKEARLVMGLQPHDRITPERPPPLNTATLGPQCMCLGWGCGGAQQKFSGNSHIHLVMDFL